MDIEVKIEAESVSSSSQKLTNNIPLKIPGIVARLTKNLANDLQSLTFQRYKIAHGGEHIYMAKNSSEASKRIVRLGREENTEHEGCDYAVAFVNKRTKEVVFMPTKLICFQNITEADFQSILKAGENKIDYSADYTIPKESWASKRRALTDEFGSAKKIKLLDAAKRRQIENETLSIMMNSAFSSSTVKKKVKTEKEDGGETGKEKGEVEANISMLSNSVSSVLPQPNMEAKSPGDVYSLSMFLSDAEVASCKSEAVNLLNYPKKELLEKGFSRQIYNLVGDNINENGNRACYLILLEAMIRFYKILRKRRYLTEKDWLEMQFPSIIMSTMRAMFFPGGFVKESQRSRSLKMAVSLLDKDRLLAHMLCLAIILDNQNFSLAITPWAHELSVNEQKITKIATALGCSINSASTSENLRLDTARIAQLSGPPQKSRKPGEQKRRKR